MPPIPVLYVHNSARIATVVTIVGSVSGRKGHRDSLDMAKHVLERQRQAWRA